MLVENKCIRELRLSNNPLGDTGGAHVAEGLSKSKSLRVAHMSDTKVSG
jgi:Ran GTPase-activating protein (RanGAP) involved in mRNA processing and transport